MENKFPDNEIDNAFRSAIESMESEPSAKFWEDSEKNIALNSGKISNRKAGYWKTISIALIILLGISASYIGYLHMKIDKTTSLASENKNRTVTSKNNSNINSEQNSNQNKLASVNENSTNEKQVAYSKSENVNQLPTTIPSIEKNAFANETKNNPPKAKTNQVQLNPVDHAALNQHHISGTDNMNFGKPQESTAHLADAIQNYITNNLKPISDSAATVIREKPELPVIPAENPVQFFSTNDIDSFPRIAATSSNENLIPPVHSPFFIGGFYAPTYLSKTVVRNNQSGDASNSIDLHQNEKPEFSYAFGLKFGMDLGARWTFRTGINYTHSCYTLAPKTILNDNLGNESSYTIATSSGTFNYSSEGDSIAITGNSFQGLSYVNTPFLMSYNFGKKRFGFFVSAGLNATMLVNANSTLFLINEDREESTLTGKIDGLRKFNMGYSTSFGANYQLSKHFILTAEPFFSGSFATINKNTPFLTHSRNLGCEAGIIYHF